eukprot:TRINITY_DN4961_c0_g1_i1.p1 TRINITY_DN4961_c0_g1~~TRINITY_DN4961_c0_g1_i1.p1  ORF type:complete len:486 (+),score=72.41 TRINITY_DN4961_c0_g1_i1:574-2031(+)
MQMEINLRQPIEFSEGYCDRQTIISSSTDVWKSSYKRQLSAFANSLEPAPGSGPSCSAPSASSSAPPSGGDQVDESRTGNVSANDGQAAVSREESDVEETDWIGTARAMEQRRRFQKGEVEVRSLLGHKGRVWACAMQGSTIASGSEDETVRLWNRPSGRCLLTLRPPVRSGAVRSVVLDDAKVVAAAGTDVFIWQRSTGRLLRRIGGHHQAVKAIGVDDMEVFAGCADGCVRIFDLYGSTCKQIFRLHKRAVTCLGFAADLRLLASGGADGTLEVRHVDSAQSVASLLSLNPMAGVECLDFAPDGFTLTAGTATGTLHRWDLRKATQPIIVQKLYTNALTAVHAASYSPATVLTAGFSGVIHVLDGQSCAPVRSLVRPQPLGLSLHAPCKIDPSPPLVDFSNQSQRRREGQSGRPGGHQSSSQNSVSEGMGFREGRATMRSRSQTPLEGVQQQRTCSPVHCLSVGMTSAVAGHSDGSVAIWSFQ